MSHWRQQMVDGAEHLISCQIFSVLLVTYNWFKIQRHLPSVGFNVTAGYIFNIQTLSLSNQLMRCQGHWVPAQGGDHWLFPIFLRKSQIHNFHNAFLTIFSFTTILHNTDFQFLGVWFSSRWTTSLPGIMAITIKIVSWRTPLKMAALAKEFDIIKAAKGTPITSRLILK